MRVVAAAVAAMCLSAVGVYAAADKSEEWDRIAALPGAIVSTKMETNNTALRAVDFPSGVYFREQENGSILSVDESGHGAVICLQGITISLLMAAKICPIKDREIWVQEIDANLDRIDDFIVANSWNPISRAELLKEREHQVQLGLTNMSLKPQDEITKICSSRDMKWLTDTFDKKTPAQIRESTDHLISVPRPPVVNWCL